MKLFAWLFKVITFTNCILHFPSLLHSFYYHPHPFPPCPLHQKARKPTRIEELSNRAKLGIPTFRGSKLAPCTRAHKHGRATLSRDNSWVLVFFGVRLVWVFTSHWPLHHIWYQSYISSWPGIESTHPNFLLLHFTITSQPLFSFEQTQAWVLVWA